MSKIAVIGLGRVGLPLALLLSSEGHEIMGIDRDGKIVSSLMHRHMPFDEPQCKELLSSSTAVFSDDISLASFCDTIIITVGTPFLPHIEMDLNHLRTAIESIIPSLEKGKLVILRSTIAPNTTKFVKNLIEKHSGYIVGKDIFLAFCPERLAEGVAIEELQTLPQIIGTEDEKSKELAYEIFKFTECIPTDYITAELIKLFTNIFRYIQFSIPNYFMYIAENYNANIFKIIELINYRYPRGGLKRPGFVAGTCLRKDFAPISMDSFGVDLGMLSWKINEYSPLFLIKAIKKYTTLTNKEILVCGYSFKANTDDIRDSLSEKFVRLLKNEVPKNLSIYDPYVEGYKTYLNIDYDIIFITTCHDQFNKEYFKNLGVDDNTYIVDIWNVCKTNKLIFKKGEI